MGGMSGRAPTIVSNLQNTLVVHEKVCHLEITVKDVLLVQIHGT